MRPGPESSVNAGAMPTMAGKGNVSDVGSKQGSPTVSSNGSTISNADMISIRIATESLSSKIGRGLRDGITKRDGGNLPDSRVVLRNALEATKAYRRGLIFYRTIRPTLS